jgi:hypothetical protein
MRTRHVIGIVLILVAVVVKLTFFAFPIAEAGARSIESGIVHVFQIHQAVGETSGAERPRDVARLSDTGGVTDPAPFRNVSSHVTQGGAK